MSDVKDNSIVDEIFHAVMEKRHEILRKTGINPNLAIYIEYECWLRFIDHVQLIDGRIALAKFEMARNKQIAGYPVYRVVNDNQPPNHPDYRVVELND